MANSETSKSAKARAGSGQRSRSGAKSRRKQRKDPARGAALGAAGLMFVLLAFVPGHSLWAGLRSAMFGIFGASLYLIGAVLLALAWQCFQGGRGVMYVQAVLFLPLFCGLPAALAGTDYTGMNVLEVVADSYKAAAQGGWHGGVMGVVLGASLTTFCGQVVALILILIALALLIYFSFPISMAYLAQLARSAMESGKEHITDTRERREEAVRRSEELQRQNDERRAARKEREAALAARRTAFNIDVDLGPDPVQSRLAEAPAQPKPIQQPVQQEPPRIVPNFSDIVAAPRKTVTEAGNAAHSFAPPAPPAAPAMPEAEQPVQGMPVAQSQHIEVGPGGTFGLNPLREALSHRWRPKVPIEPPKVQDMHGEPDISAELGGEFDSIGDTEWLRDELLRVAYGIWDFVKNDPEQREKNKYWKLDWMGILPGKRESRRYIGDYVMTQSDVRAEGRFEDLVAYGGWSMDDHHPGGFRAPERPTIFHPAPSPYGIPYRSMYSADVENLMFAGRNISVTHTAMSSTRVMATCATIGQAVGTAAAIAVRENTTPRGVYERHLRELKQTLMEDDSYLPFNRRDIPALTKSARLECAAPDAENLRNGLDRPIGEDDNGATVALNDAIRYVFDQPQAVSHIRIIFDSDLNRTTLPECEARRNRNMLHNRPLNWPDGYVPGTMTKAFRIEGVRADGAVDVLIDEHENHQRLYARDVSGEYAEIRLIPTETWGAEKCHLFSFDVR